MRGERYLTKKRAGDYKEKSLHDNSKNNVLIHRLILISLNKAGFATAAPDFEDEYIPTIAPEKINPTGGWFNKLAGANEHTHLGASSSLDWQEIV